MYPHPLDGCTAPVLTEHEQILRRFSAAVRENQNWATEIADKKLVAKWIEEAEKKDRSGDLRRIVVWDREQIEYVYGELLNSYKPFVEKIKEEGIGIEPGIDGVWKADKVVDDTLRNEFIQAVATLENVPEDQKCWRPNSKNHVLDLVHPSLWPLIYGESIHIDTGKPICGHMPQDYEPVVPSKLGPTTAIKDPLDGLSVEAIAEERVDRPEEVYSQKFCWLPSEFEISQDGKTKIKSYINNLSCPEERELFYPLIGRIFSRFIPLFNHVLADLKGGKQNHQRVGQPDMIRRGNEYKPAVGILSPERYQELWTKVLEDFSEGRDISLSLREERPTASATDDSIDEPDDELDEEAMDRALDLKWKQFYLWDVGPIIPNSEWSPPSITPGIRLEGKTVKVIVKLANIYLTPDDPDYGGRSEEVEGMMNERIIATVIYCYDQENIESTGGGCFERTVCVPPCTPYGEFEYAHTNWNSLYGLDYNSVQSLGDVDMRVWKFSVPFVHTGILASKLPGSLIRKIFFR
ncbi:hypothetical protein TWF730_005161 [Orbilia blumenaviensis]|uniref:Uncharacterized protein n=1 Tax=Orbilia blumenaviensis TaxID=1796055 RepID=A0AAV9VIM3_9PEZI